MSTAFDKAKNIERDEEQKELDVKIVLYIGIFLMAQIIIKLKLW